MGDLTAFALDTAIVLWVFAGIGWAAGIERGGRRTTVKNRAKVHARRVQANKAQQQVPRHAK